MAKKLSTVTSQDSYVDMSAATNRGKFLFSSIVIMQLFYITVLTKFNIENLLFLCLLWFIGNSMLFWISADAKRFRVKRFNSYAFQFLFLLSAFTTVFLSRYEYISNTIEYGLADTRLNDSLGAGGVYSIVNSIFYPLAMIAAFYKKDTFFFKVALVITFLICMIDVLFIGTRNSVFFVLFFRFLFSESFQKRFRLNVLVYAFLSLLIAIILFEYSTRVRSGFEGAASAYWLEKSLYSEAMSGSVMNDALYLWANDNVWFVLPIFYFISYISHSIPEFVSFITQYGVLKFPTFAHLHQYFLAATFQDTSAANQLLEVLRIRPGYYQTLYSSLLVDFGFYIFLLFPILFFLSRLKYFFLFQIYLIPVLALSTIENYFYTGLTPLRAVIFFIFAAIWLKRSSISKVALRSQNYTDTKNGNIA